MSKRFIKTLAGVSIISFLFLGIDGTARATWEELDENQKRTLKELHTKHFYKTYYRATASLYNENQARPYKGYTTPGPTLPPTDDKTTYLDCEKCQKLGFKYIARMQTLQLIDRMDGILRTTQALYQTVGGLSERIQSLENKFIQKNPNILPSIDAPKEEIQRVENEIGSIQLAPSLLPREPEEPIKTPGIAPDLKKLGKEPKTSAIFPTHLNTAEDKGRKEEKREIARRLMDEHMKDEIVLRITGLTIEELKDLKSEKIPAPEEEIIRLSRVRAEEKEVRKNEKKNNIDTWINKNSVEVDKVWNYINSINHGSSHKLNTKLALKQYILTYGADIGHHVAPPHMRASILEFPGKMEAIRQLMFKYLTLTGTLHPRWTEFNE